MDFANLNRVVRKAFKDKDPVRLVTPSGSAIPIEAPYDSRHYEVASGEATVSALLTSVTVDLAQTGPVTTEHRIEARGILYRIADVRPDGQGMAVLALEVHPDL